MNGLRQFALALIIIGAINWGLIGFFNFDLVASIFGGQASLLSRVIYSLVGLSGLYALTFYVTGIDGLDDSNTDIDEPSYSTEFSDEFKNNSNNENKWK